MAFSNATDFQIDRSTFNDIRGDYNQRIQLDFNQQINVHARDQDIPNRLYSVMKNHISTAAYHNSGMRREISSCHPGTREVALKIISDWAEDPASHCLWLRGPAGTGKSAIAYTIAERCRLDRTLGATYFFARGSITNSPPHFFPTLAYQLALAVPDLRDPLCTALCEDPAVLDKSMSEQLDTLIVQPLLTLSNQPEHTVIIIDGLDEYDCTRGPAIQTDIVRLILGLGEHSFPLRFIISSRPETGIRRAFESPCSSLTHLPLDTVDPLRDILLPRSPLNTMYPDRDIRRFLYDKLGQVYEDCVKDKTLVALRTTWPPYEAIEQLVKKSSGHFIYASTVVKFIQEGHGNPVDRLEAVLQAPSATAFQELDQLYLHILRKAGDPEELKWILRAIMYLDDKAKLVSNLEAIFSRISGIRFLLGNLRSIVEVTKLSEAIPVCEHISEFLEVRFFHASMNDFLLDPARSCEFYVSLGQFQAGLAFEYARLIILFPIAVDRVDLLTMAITGLIPCLEGTYACPGLLPSTLKKISIVIDEGPKSPLPCICYSGLDCLLRTLEGVPDSGGLREKIKAFQLQLEPQLTELSDSVFTLARAVGICIAVSSLYPAWETCPSQAEVDQLIGAPTGLEIIQQTLDLPKDRVYFSCIFVCTQEFPDSAVKEIHRSLLRWLRQPKGMWGFITPMVRSVLRPLPQITMEKHLWAWAWETTGFVPYWDDEYPVHDLDLIYCCFRTLFLGITQPSDILEEDILKVASTSITRYWRLEPRDGHKTPSPLQQLVNGIDFTPISRALSTISTKLYPRLFYFIRALDKENHNLHLADENSTLWRCLRNIYSHILQDPIVSHTTSVLYAMFQQLPPKSIELLLGIAPGKLFRSPAMQALFGVGILQRGDKQFKLSAWLLPLLRSGTVKLQHDAPSNYDINVCISNAHEHLAIACAEYMLSYPGLIGQDVLDVLDEQDSEDEDEDERDPFDRDIPKRDGWTRAAEPYAMKFWTMHLRNTKHSERLFEILRRVVCSRDDVEPVIEWLEEGTDTPDDVLFRWHAARLKYNTQTDGFVSVTPVFLPSSEKVHWSDKEELF